ncbi:ligand-dependent nuclear receptor corepressor-like protein [Saccoglossus kowalevskii]|uniref:Uncharacterized protein LOC102806435 n=1 Tax=Saccoglossus kowalevskii TaxID=10224 RepID=A0ABM0N113_SACKO|nr:PREDICTED: uncharacterized protein LOC102806435 [Saccoglossus kowalevskii]
MAAAVSCGNIRCQQERRQLRKELERGRKNLITTIGLECVAETLFGPDLLKKVLPYYQEEIEERDDDDYDDEHEHEVVDWKMYQDCSLCSARQQLVAESLARHQRYIESMKVANNDQKHSVYLEYMHPDIIRESDLYSISESPSSSQPPSHPATPLPTQVPLESGSPQPLDLSKRSSSPDVLHNGKSAGNSFLRVPSLKLAGQHHGEVSSRRGRPPFKSSYNSTYTEADLRQAIRDVRSGKLGTRRAAILYGIPRSTIRNHLNKPTVWRNERSSLPRGNSSSSLGDLLEKQPIVLNNDNVDSIKVEEKEWNGNSREAKFEDSVVATNGDLECRPSLFKEESLFSSAVDSLTSASNGINDDEVDPVTKLRNFLKEKPDPEQICKRQLTMGELMHDSAYNDFLSDIPGRDEQFKNKRGSLNYANEIKLPFPPSVFRQLIEQRVSEKQEMQESQRSERESSSNTPLKVPTYKPLNPLAGQSDAADKSKTSLMKDFGINRNSFSSDHYSSSSKSHHHHSHSHHHHHHHHNNSYDSHHKRKHEDLDKPQKQSRPKRGRYRCYDRDNLIQAVEAVQRGEMTVTRAGNVFGVPHSTLEYKVKERHLQRQSKRASKRHRDFSDADPSSKPSSPVLSPSSSSVSLASLASSTSSTSSFLERSISGWSSSTSDRHRLVPSILRKNRSHSSSSSLPGSMFASLLERPPLVAVSSVDEARRIQEVMNALRGPTDASPLPRSTENTDCFIVGEVTSPTDQPKSLRELFERHSERPDSFLAEYGALGSVAGAGLGVDGSISSFLQKAGAMGGGGSHKSSADEALQDSAIKTDTSAIYQRNLTTNIDTALKNIMSAFHKGTTDNDPENDLDRKEQQTRDEERAEDSNSQHSSVEFKAKLRRSFEKTAQDVEREMLLRDDDDQSSSDDTSVYSSQSRVKNDEIE